MLKRRKQTRHVHRFSLLRIRKHHNQTPKGLNYPLPNSHNIKTPTAKRLVNSHTYVLHCKSSAAEVVSAIVEAQTQRDKRLLETAAAPAAAAYGGAELRHRRDAVGPGEGRIRRHGEDLLEEVVGVALRWVVGQAGERGVSVVLEREVTGV